MIVKEIKNKNEWESFLFAQMNTLFVQSWNYGEFYKSMGEEFWVFGIYNENGVIIGGSLVVSTHAKRGNFLYLPYGPILPDKESEKALNVLVNFIQTFAKEKRGYDFIKASPFINDTEENKKIFKRNKFNNAPLHILAETTWLLDLSKTEEELLEGMNKNHRNLIRRCIREGVKIEKSKSLESMNNFLHIYDTTAQRHKFHKFSDNYIAKEFEAFAQYNQSLLLSARMPNDTTVDSAAIIMYYGNTAAYRHGASLNTDKKLPASYLIQWEAIKEAKARGMKWYNFWGIAPERASKNHPFWGITHFKKGFGGIQKNLLHCQDLPLTGKYYLNWFVETIRKIKRGF